MFRFIRHLADINNGTLYFVCFILFLNIQHKYNTRNKKKEDKKLALEKHKAAKVIVDAAYAVPNHLDNFKPFSKYTMSGLDLVIEYYTIDNLPKDVFNWAFELTKTNMEEIYNQAWGWKDGVKKSELRDSKALYLVAKERESNKLAAFAHFRFEWEPDKDACILYLWELQTEKAYQSKGVGKFLMLILELIGSKMGMKFIMLTVFHVANPRALKFYQKLKFEIDELSPSKEDMFADECFEILSKPLRLLK
eukprot:TRINITY_DN4918_c0_g1_i2.p1 TRINITY_DN4918_c0_g1~~TRINITY_DN4918_c0_g1_i2.p1  ORF type:complete len:250 (+),score=29.12 TRINITY_DN4918_c0_g1_i2:100-849(+)